MTAADKGWTGRPCPSCGVHPRVGKGLVHHPDCLVLRSRAKHPRNNPGTYDTPRWEIEHDAQWPFGCPENGCMRCNGPTSQYEEAF